MIRCNDDKGEACLSTDPFYDLPRYFESIRIFNDFKDRLKNGKMKNDGSDELLSIIDHKIIEGKSNSFRTMIPKGRKLFRARVVDPDEMLYEKGFGIESETNNLLGFNETESREPPLGISGSGRNNYRGATYLYLSNKPATACSEIKPKIRQIISLAEFETVKSIRIIDFSSRKHLKKEEGFDIGRLITDIMFMYYEPVTNEDEYYATQYLTDYIRKTGIDGISYRSFYDETGINYTIFNSDHRKIKFCSSRLVLFQSESKVFLDFNNAKIIKSNSVGGKKYDFDSALKMRHNIIVSELENNK